MSALIVVTHLFLASTAAADPRVEIEIEIRNTATPNDDYITWAPTLARIRMVTKPGEPLPENLEIVVSNAAPEHPSSTRAEAPHGMLLFAKNAGAFKAGLEANPKQDELQTLGELTLPVFSDGSWTSFVVAGAFGHPSLKDKDAVIFVRRKDTNAEVGHHALMVRVRKDIDKMKPEERRAFLLSLAEYRLRNPSRVKTYLGMVRVHDLAARGFDTGEYSDQAHKGAGFLPWHRAFLLQMERDIQEFNPAFALPFWRLYQPSPSAFSADFTGSNSISQERANGGKGPLITAPEVTEFTPGNPLYGWFSPGMGPLMRWTDDRNAQNFSKPQDIIASKSYDKLTGHIESNPHNVGHGWVGPWMSNCKISPSDPLFWVFHGEFDRLWAAWQQNHDMFLTDGSNPDVFRPNDTYERGHREWKGHHLFDTMWPWDGDTSAAPDDFGARRPGDAPGGRFARSSLPGLWPAEDATPRPADMIDYAGYADRRNDLGFGFEDLPWSPRQKAGDVRPRSARLEQKAQREPESLPAVMETHDGLALLQKAEATEAQKLEALDALRLRMFMRSMGMDHSLMAGSSTTCQRLNDVNEKKSVRYSAARNLVTENEPCVVDFMQRQLDAYAGRDDQMVFPPATAMGFLLSTRTALLSKAQSSIRRFLQDSRAPVRRMAALALYGDLATLDARVKLWRDKKEDESVRVAALQGLIRDAADFTCRALEIAQDPKESPQLRAHAVASVGTWLMDNAVTTKKSQLACLQQAVDSLPPATEGHYLEAVATVGDILKMSFKYSVDSSTSWKCERNTTKCERNTTAAKGE
jgi:hypothetical protein